ncbi:phosducin-like protein [Malaya genurostris]|uniref:phosducin-like protein n=1 Tax=Malaya genurostris TaxID=325434 RepID=UPI0026F3E68D|nr:phosducin-like protein [Malaya genurostris]XP_058455248.1 phosducin-like protein [Malaya genurostris]
MVSLDDKIMGEKTSNYCSSSEDECESEIIGSKDGNATKSTKSQIIAENKLENETHWTGNATNTGPKGVIKDWQRFKQLETEKRESQDREKLDLFKKLSITSRTNREHEKANEKEQIDDELAELLDEDFLLQYQKKRIAEMLALAEKLPTFGSVIELHTGDDFLIALDEEQKSVTIVIHIYDQKDDACQKMNEALNNLAAEYKNVKFCKFLCFAAGLSMSFKENGIPALLVYKNGEMIGNFVRITDDLSDEFTSFDVQSYLIEVGMLPDKSFVSKN